LNKHEIPDVNFHQFSESFIRSISCLFEHFYSYSITYDLNIDEDNESKNEIIQYLAWLQNLTIDDFVIFQAALSNFSETHLIIPRNEIGESYWDIVNTPLEEELLLATFTNSKCMNLIAEQLLTQDDKFEFYSVSLAEIKPTSTARGNDKTRGYFPEDSITPVGHFSGFKVKRFGYSFLAESSRKDLLEYFKEYPSFLYFPRFYIDHSKQKNKIYYFSTTDDSGKDKGRKCNWEVSRGTDDIKFEMVPGMKSKTFNKSLDRWNEIISGYHLDKSNQENDILLWTLSIGTHLLPTGNYEWDDDPSLNSRCGVFFIIKTKIGIDIKESIYPIIGHIKNSLTQYLANGVYELVKRNTEEMKRHSEVLHLLMRPLKDMSSAISAMQRDAQELKFLLYDPSEALFECRHLISDCFEQGKSLQISDYKNIEIEHSPGNYNDNAKVVLAYIICRLFGNTNIFTSAMSDDEIITRATASLDNISISYGNVYDKTISQLWQLIDPQGIRKCNSDRRLFKNYFSCADKADFIDALNRIKYGLFTPFKFYTEEWPLIALELIVQKVKYSKVGDSSLTSAYPKLMLNSHQTPYNYKSILQFIRDIVNYTNSDENHAKLKHLKIISNKPPNLIASIQLCFNKDHIIVSKISQLKSYVEGLFLKKESKIGRAHV